MYTALLTFVLVASGPQPVVMPEPVATPEPQPGAPLVAECPCPPRDYREGVAGCMYGPPPRYPFRQLQRLHPPCLYAPRQGYDWYWYRFFYRPTFDYRRQFNFPWRSPPYRHPVGLRCGCPECSGPGEMVLDKFDDIGKMSTGSQ